MSATTTDAAPELYTVNRSQDGAQVRAELTLDQAKEECAILNAQARMPTGQTVEGTTIYGSMIHGQISRYEIQSASGLVVS